MNVAVVSNPMNDVTDIYTSHRIARFQRPEKYPTRCPVPDDKVAFSTPYPTYLPAEFTTDKPIGSGADTPLASRDELLQRFADGAFKSAEGTILIDSENGRPLNIRGRTGITGLGLLYHFGVNNAADAIVARFNPELGDYEVLLIQRRSGRWALPGGFYLPRQELSMDASFRELSEETSVSEKQIRSTLRMRPVEVYRGYADDSRNTDNAWVETSAWLFHVDYEESRKFPVKAGDDAMDAKWTSLREIKAELNFSNHKHYILEAVKIIPSLDKELLPVTPVKHSPRLKDFAELRAAGCRKIAIFGGSFDLVHRGHLDVAQSSMNALGVDAIVFIPTSQNPLKPIPTMFSAEERTEVLEKVLERFPGFFLSEFEINRSQGAPSYTIDTLRHVHAELNPQGVVPIQVFLILGADHVDSFQRWDDRFAIGRLAQVVFHNRGSVTGAELAAWEARAKALLPETPAITLLTTTTTVSATEFRDSLANGKRRPAEILPVVADFLESRGQRASASHSKSNLELPA